MKKRKMKFFAIAVAMFMTICSFAQFGCGGDNKPDETKTVVRVSVQDAGFGTAYMYEAEKAFEDLYSNVSFEEGKKGVDIYINPNKVIGTDLQANIAYSSDDVFFTEQIYYKEFASQGLVAKLDDVISDTGSNFGEAKSVSDKMPSVIKDAYTHTDGSVYALPTYLTSVGINYNVKLFDEYKLYFAKDGGFIKSGSDAKSAGPDGLFDTYDDGLPATYADFYSLCEKMLSNHITPVSWGDLTYVNALLTELQSDYEGVENMSINFTFNGTATNLVKKINLDGSIELEEKTISSENGYDVYKQAGRYYALSFIENLIKKGYVNTASLSSSTAYSYTTAQQDFIYSGIDGKKEIGMLIEGCWWENEASPLFKELESVKGAKYAKKNFSFGFMPLPKATEAQVGKKSCCTSVLGAGVIVNAKTTGAKLEVAKKFLRYMFTDAQMNNFIKNTGVPYVYDFEKNTTSCSDYGISLNNYMKNSDIVYPFSNNELYIKNASRFNVWFYHWDTMVNNQSYSDINPIIDNAFSAEQFFNGIYTLRKKEWSSLTK